jgi:hypothetical protein
LETPYLKEFNEVPKIPKEAKRMDSLDAAMAAHMALGGILPTTKNVKNMKDKLKALGAETQREQPLPHLMIKVMLVVARPLRWLKAYDYWLKAQLTSALLLSKKRFGQSYSRARTMLRRSV